MFAAIPWDLAGQVIEPLRPAGQRLDQQQRPPVTDRGQRLGERGRGVLLFSHELIVAPGVDNWGEVSSNLQVTSYREGSDDNL